MNVNVFFKKFFIGACQVVGALLLFSLVQMVLVAPVFESQKRKITDVPPDTFPVLILVPLVKEGAYEARVIPYKDLASYQREIKNLTLLVPPHLEKQLNDQLSVFCKEAARLHRQDRQKYPEDCFSCGFKIKKRDADKQSLQVEYSSDDDRPNIGWYDATDKEIFPKSNLSLFATAFATLIFPISLIVTIFLWKLIAKRCRKAWGGKSNLTDK